MGSVHLARDEVLGRQVALKRIGMAPGADGPDLARAEREARLAAALNHPHVVAVFDLVEDDDQRWLAMEYVEGETLSELIRRAGRLDEQRAADLGWQAADALAAAHSAGIVHRDVKPSNILVATADGQAKLTDFGIARSQTDASLTQTGLVTGSPAYLAPEVASGSTATAASDVWSLGATIYHLLAGRPPYEVGDNLLGALYKIVHEDPPRLPGAGSLAALLEATMVKDPDARWSMAQVRDYLGSVVQGVEPTATLPVAAAAAEPEATSVLPVVAAAPPPPTPAATPGPAPAPTSRRAATGDRWRAAVPVLAGLVVLVVVALIIWALLPDGDGTDQTAQQPGGSRSAPSQSETPSDSDSDSDSVEPQPPTNTRQAMEGFITDYLATVTSDPSAAWERLTPEFQAASGGLDGYTGFWETIASATPSAVEADPEDLTVQYTVDYVRENGSRTQDQVELQLVRQDNGYLIAGEAD
jgi:serine/threonine protein kinase